MEVGFSFPIFTQNFRTSRYGAIRWIVDLLYPISIILLISISCRNLSNAFAMSRNITSVVYFLFNPSVLYSTRLSIWCSVKSRCLYPNCSSNKIPRFAVLPWIHYHYFLCMFCSLQATVQWEGSFVQTCCLSHFQYYDHLDWPLFPWEIWQSQHRVEDVGFSFPGKARQCYIEYLVATRSFFHFQFQDLVFYLLWRSEFNSLDYLLLFNSPSLSFSELLRCLRQVECLGCIDSQGCLQTPHISPNIWSPFSICSAM